MNLKLRDGIKAERDVLAEAFDECPARITRDIYECVNPETSHTLSQTICYADYKVIRGCWLKWAREQVNKAVEE